MVDLLKVGDKAPDFYSVDQKGNEVRLSHFKGSPVVLYFYPKDDTPGCTIEACDFRDSHSAFEDLGINVLGVSVDDSLSHRDFVRKYDLNFTLVADDSKEISRQYGTLEGEVSRRVTYLIDGEGTIVHVYPKVSPDKHSEEVLEKLRTLKLIDQ